MTERQPRQPGVRADEPHDILAADEFEIGTRDERLPPDPSGITVPHDVLAAEEFAMPAAGERHDDGSGPGPRTLVPIAVALALAIAFVLALRRRG